MIPPDQGGLQHPVNMIMVDEAFALRLCTMTGDERCRAMAAVLGREVVVSIVEAHHAYYALPAGATAEDRLAAAVRVVSAGV